ncbi:hypothetical protein G6F24_014627 [Rhizopus arrhizus]|nr:hypothetical protein G6F24_014627 [Rhizopus arrhizus]
MAGRSGAARPGPPAPGGAVHQPVRGAADRPGRRHCLAGAAGAGGARAAGVGPAGAGRTGAAPGAAHAAGQRHPGRSRRWGRCCAAGTARTCVRAPAGPWPAVAAPASHRRAGRTGAASRRCDRELLQRLPAGTHRGGGGAAADPGRSGLGRLGGGADPVVHRAAGAVLHDAGRVGR